MREPRIPQRTRQATLVFLAALAVVLLIHLTVGLGDILLFGLVGGLVGCLVVIGLDLLHNAQRATERDLGSQHGTADASPRNELPEMRK